MTRNQRLFSEANRHLVGGVNSPVRAFKSVGGTPPFITRAKGAYLFDAEGKKYLDLIGGWGPHLLGHGHPAVVAAVRKAAAKGSSFGLPTESEARLASLIKSALPSIDKLRFVNSGTEATMSALRLARGFTRRDLILKFDGCYHGHADGLLAGAGSGLATFGIPASPGVPKAFAELTLTIPYNDLPALEKVFRKHGRKIAAVIVEPVVGNMGVILPQPGFLQALRSVTTKYGALLILDEVMTGFRVAWGGAQIHYGVTPDLTTLGKVIGAGYPVGAYGGRAEIMKMISPSGPVYQAGTLSGNPVAMAAGIAALGEIRKDLGRYDRLADTTRNLCGTIRSAARAAGVEVAVSSACGMFTVFFGPGPIVRAADARKADPKKFGRFFNAMRRKGILLPPSQFEAAFLSFAHGPGELRTIASAIAASL